MISSPMLMAQQLCAACALRPVTYTRAIAGIEFTAPGDQLMRAFKAKGRLTEAGLFARLLWRNMQRVSPRLPALDALVPIPSSRDAILKRGFNPAGEIARELAWLSGVPLRRTWCRRTRETSSQKTLNWRARQDSVRGLYQAQVPQECGWVGLVDDVLTTGSTLEEASESLLRAGARGVVALVAARTLAK
jgi:predicted amidophosphoribosyltransferase